MSVVSWKQEFYPVDASQCKTWGEAVQHSILKWSGLRPEALENHEVRLKNGEVFSENDYFSFRESTCALCEVAEMRCASRGKDNWCNECVLSESRGGFSCDVAKPGERISPWKAMVFENNPKPMIEALDKLKEIV